MDILRGKAVADLVKLRCAKTERIRLIVKRLLPYCIDDRIGFKEVFTSLLYIIPDYFAEAVRL